MRGLTGHYSISKSGGETVRAFVPDPLPPTPALVWDVRLQELSQRAMLALGRLDGLTGLLPDVSQFLYTVNSAFVRLTDLGIVEEKTRGARGRVFAY